MLIIKNKNNKYAGQIYYKLNIPSFNKKKCVIYPLVGRDYIIPNMKKKQ